MANRVDSSELRMKTRKRVCRLQFLMFSIICLLFSACDDGDDSRENEVNEQGDVHEDMSEDVLEEECLYGGTPGNCVSDPPCDQPIESYPEGSWCNPGYGHDAGTDSTDAVAGNGGACDSIGELDVSNEYIVVARLPGSIEDLPQMAFLVGFEENADQTFDVNIRVLNQEECPADADCESYKPRKPSEMVQVASDVAVSDNGTLPVFERLALTEDSLPAAFRGFENDSMTIGFDLAPCANGVLCGDGSMAFEDGDVVQSMRVTVGSVRLAEEDTVYDPPYLPTNCRQSADVAAGTAE